MTEPTSAQDLFKGRHFDQEIIVVCIRWYLTFKLSSRDLVQMMAERGIASSHTTILRWVQRYVPEFEKRWSRYARAVGDSWRVMRLISRSVVSGCTCIAQSTNNFTPSIFLLSKRREAAN
jgi:transposase-like protein